MSCIHKLTTKNNIAHQIERERERERKRARERRGPCSIPLCGGQAITANPS